MSSLDRQRLHELLGLDKLKAADQHQRTCHCLQREDLGRFWRESWSLLLEDGKELPFWLLRPPGPGPHPLAILPHGHGQRGRDIYAGIADKPERQAWMLAEDRDVACQAVERGFVAIAPTVRGFDELAIPDRLHRYHGQDCISTFHHHLAAGQILTGLRVWDMMRLLDWAISQADVDPDKILMMGNSCGGMVTSYTAACDERIAVAVASCSFAPFVNTAGNLHHHDCNTVPGILAHGEFWDVLALIAPRSLMVVHGQQDDLFPPAEIERAVSHLKERYQQSGHGSRCAHAIGPGGHRFYKDLTWPFIETHMARTS